MMKVAELELATALAGLTHLQVHFLEVSSLDLSAWTIALHMHISSEHGAWLKDTSDDSLDYSVFWACCAHGPPCAAVQDLHLQCICGPDGGFLAMASPTLRSLHMEGLPDFKARGMLSHTCHLSLNLAVLWLLWLLVPGWCTSPPGYCINLNSCFATPKWRLLSAATGVRRHHIHMQPWCPHLALRRLLQSRSHLLRPRQSVSPTGRMTAFCTQV